MVTEGIRIKLNSVPRVIDCTVTVESLYVDQYRELFIL
jgi:hypothetical protein